MTGGPIEAAAAKYAGPVAKESWRQGRQLYQRLQPDHGSISQCPNLQRFYGDRVVMLVGVAPTRSAKPVATSNFVRASQQVAEAVFVGLAPKTDYTGRDRVRLKVQFDDDPISTPRHILEFCPTGLMYLQWGLDVAAGPDGIDPFPVSEFIQVLRRVHSVVQLPVYQQLHAKRIGERRRHLDWRVGVSGSISTPTGSLAVDEFDTPQAADFVRAERHDLLGQPAGFAPRELTGVKSAAPFKDMLRPIIEDLVANSGFVDPHGATEVIMMDHEADWS